MQAEQLTYAQLEQLLTALGYRLAPSSPDARVFVYPEFDAVSVLPNANGTEPARPHHLITLRKVSVEKGIVAEDEFAARLSAILKSDTDPLARAS